MVGNYAIQDQRMAIQWVKRNIHAYLLIADSYAKTMYNRFGGDPDKISIIGESAGATSVAVNTFAMIINAFLDSFSK